MKKLLKKVHEKRFEKRFEVRKFFVGTNRTRSLSEQSADSSEEPTCCPRLTLDVILGYVINACFKMFCSKYTSFQL